MYWVCQVLGKMLGTEKTLNDVKLSLLWCFMDFAMLQKQMNRRMTTYSSTVQWIVNKTFSFKQKSWTATGKQYLTLKVTFMEEVITTSNI